MKFSALISEREEKGYIPPDFLFDCPGCQCAHGVWTTRANKKGAMWSYNGDPDKPTVNPSIVVRYQLQSGSTHVCHSYIRDGHIEYLDDCTHELRGKTVTLPEIT